MIHSAPKKIIFASAVLKDAAITACPSLSKATSTPSSGI
jgi:hypothetical protein